jgi:thiamine-phosphate pyrophosphorylase
MTKENLRLLDANLNRLREGIRVVEDIYRYIFNDKETSSKLKNLRHRSRIDIYKELLDSRDIQNDVLKSSTKSEQSRSDLDAILIANLKAAGFWKSLVNL